MSKIICIRLEDATVEELRRRARADKQDVEVALSMLVEELVRRAPPAPLIDQGPTVIQ